VEICPKFADESLSEKLSAKMQSANFFQLNEPVPPEKFSCVLCGDDTVTVDEYFEHLW
jgi:hypothetical protein